MMISKKKIKTIMKSKSNDEISTEFGLGSNANKEPEIVDGLKEFDDFDNVD